MIVTGSIQSAGMTDSWQEYRRLERLAGGAVRLSVCGREFVGVRGEVCPADEENSERDELDGEPAHQDGGFPYTPTGWSRWVTRPSSRSR